jgi:hypothetical protein
MQALITANGIPLTRHELAVLCQKLEPRMIYLTGCFIYTLRNEGGNEGYVQNEGRVVGAVPRPTTV